MFEPILLPLDGSAMAERALPPALALAASAAAELILLRVVPPPTGTVPDAMTGYGALRQDVSGPRGHRLAADYLRTVCEGLPPAVMARPLVDEGEAADSILAVARQERAGLIAMSSHGKSGLARWMLGSVTERVLQEAPCPVLVARGERPVRRIAIPLDGSDLSARALAPGLECARLFGAEVFFVHVLEAGGAAETGPGEELLRQAAQSAGWPEANSRFVVRAGPPADRIVDLAGELDIDLIVMLTHGRRGLQRWRYGSVTEKVLHAAPCSLLVIRPAAEGG